MNGGGSGGGIYAIKHPAVVHSSSFVMNRADTGGGLALVDADSKLTSFFDDDYVERHETSVRDCLFIGNEASSSVDTTVESVLRTKQGGGMYISEVYWIEMTNLTFIQNEAEYGGFI